MATKTISPVDFWQLDHDYVTERNPATKKIETNARYAILAAFDYDDIPYGALTNWTFTVTGNLQNYQYNKMFYKGTLTDFPIGCYVKLGGADNPDWASSNHIEEWSKTFPAIGINSSYSAAEYMTNVTLDLTYVDVPLISCSKSGAYVDPKNESFFKFSSYQENAYKQHSIASGTFYYKVSGSLTYTSVPFVGDTASVPANTFSATESYEFYADIVMVDGMTTTSDPFTFTTEDSIPVTTAVSPSNRVTVEEVTFQWDYNSASGAEQYAFDIQYSDDQAAWNDVASHVVSALQIYTATVPESGTLYWRVRGYNQDDIAGAWSNVCTFINYYKADTPVLVGVSGTGRITVSWSSNDQIAYRVSVGSYDSGWIYSMNTTHFVNEYLPNGDYEIKVKIINSIGMSSDWGIMPYTQNIVSAVPVVTVEMCEGYNWFEVDADNFSKVYVLKDGKVSGIVTGEGYSDFFCNGTESYTFRGINADDTFGDTTITATYVCRKPAVISIDGQIIYVNERLDEEPQITSSVSGDVAAVSYLGASKPVHHVGTETVRSWSVSCSANIEVGKRYFYRNFRGDKAWVICKNVQSSLNFLGVHEYQFTLEETDFAEGIEYELPS